jgi:hypothetical protein
MWRTYSKPDPHGSSFRDTCNRAFPASEGTSVGPLRMVMTNIPYHQKGRYFKGFFFNLFIYLFIYFFILFFFFLIFGHFLYHYQWDSLSTSYGHDLPSDTTWHKIFHDLPSDTTWHKIFKGGDLEVFETFGHFHLRGMGPPCTVMTCIPSDLWDVTWHKKLWGWGSQRFSINLITSCMVMTCIPSDASTHKKQEYIRFRGGDLYSIWNIWELPV